MQGPLHVVLPGKNAVKVSRNLGDADPGGTQNLAVADAFGQEFAPNPLQALQ